MVLYFQKRTAGKCPGRSFFPGKRGKGRRQKTINRILSDVKLRESMEEEPYRMIQAHRIEKSVFRLEKIYERLS